MHKQPQIPGAARLAPFVGFAGTIVGQSLVFMHVSAPGPVSPRVLMMDVIAALIATLMLTVLALVPYAVLTHVRAKRR